MPSGKLLRVDENAAGNPSSPSANLEKIANPSMRNPIPIHWSLASLAASILTVILCMAYIDRPIADFVQEHFHQRSFQTCMDGFLHVTPIALLLALLLLFAAGYAVLRGQ